MLVARSHPRDDSAITEQDREHGLVERDQALQNVEEEASESWHDAMFQETT
jgi:hypothetical protein